MGFTSIKYILGAVGIERFWSFAKNRYNSYKCDYINYQHHEYPDGRPPTSLLILGKTGNGKSSLANTILRLKEGDDNEWFKTSDNMDSETKVCHTIKKKVFGRELLVVDTPGLLDTKGQSALDEIAKILMASPQGYDALLIVLKYPSRMTKEEAGVLSQLEAFFGKSFKDHAIVVMTGGDNYKSNHKQKPFEKYITDQPCYDENRFAGKWLLFDNKCTNHPDERFEQSKHLIEEVDKISKQNYGRRYTNKMFEEAQEIIDMKKTIMNQKDKIIAMQQQMARVVIKHAAVSGCFPATSTVIKYPGFVTEMQHIKIGDSILSVNQSGEISYTEVYMDAHKNPDACFPVLKIKTENHILEVSEGHYIQVNEECCYKLARDVSVGDNVFTCNQKNPKCLVKEKVIAIESGIGKGIYNPMTMNGLLLVDGVLATCYDEQFYPSYSHFFMGAIRCLYQVCPRLLAKMNESRVNGIPKWSWHIMNIWN